jgi:hypothetical protein
MNLGLGHLTELKAHLLNEALRSETTYDTAIAALGKGVAARLERACNRSFRRTVGDVFEGPGDVAHFTLPRYPVEAISAITLRENLTDGFVDQGAVADLVENISHASGLVTLSSPLSALRSSRLRATYTGGYWYPTAPAVVVLSDTVAIDSGGFAADVTFATAFAGVPSVRCSVVSPEGEAILGATAYTITAQGFTARLSAATGAAGYVLSWVAVYGDADADPALLQPATVALASGDGYKDITFGTAFTAAPVVVCQVNTPTGGYLVACAPSLVTTTGFRALLSYQLDAAGYTLSYLALSPTAAAAAATLPEGATALPDDLKFAWLLQCEHLWKLRDKLGVSIAAPAGSQAPSLTLAGAELIPEVAAIARAHRRFTL